MPDIHLEHPQCVRKALRIEWFLFFYNAFEAVASILFGISAGSAALLGFGLDSVIEASAVAVLIRRLSVHTSDEQEQKAEKKALFLIGLSFYALAAYVGFDSAAKLIQGQAPQASPGGIAIAVLSLATMPVFAAAKKKIARKIGSKALEADAMETLVCGWLSGALLAGLVLNSFLGWWWADPVAGLGMAVFMMHEGRETVEESRA